MSAARGYEYIDSCSLEWAEFKNRFGKTYNDLLEHDKRKAIFCVNLNRINSYNRRLGFKKLGINWRSDWTKEEIEQIMMNEPIDEHDGMIQFPNFLNLTDNPPAELDFRSNKRIVGPIKDQGHCGSCWAFAAVALIEANEHKWDSSISHVTRLSEQQLVDCVERKGGEDGCSGRNYLDSLSYVKAAGGLMKSIDYRYVSGVTEKSQDNCKFEASKIYPASRKFNNFIRITGADEILLKRIIASYGPVMVSIEAKQEFHDIEGKNIILDPECTGQKTNHAVLLVGYGHDNKQGLDYWIIKNSWGYDWADEGFGYMARNMNNNCSIASKPVILI